jgi:hypothetical protein
MQVNEKRRSETKAGTQDGPGESGEQRRGLRIIDLGVEGEEGAAVEEEEGEAEEEKDAFEVALASVARITTIQKSMSRVPVVNPIRRM